METRSTGGSASIALSAVSFPLRCYRVGPTCCSHLEMPDQGVMGPWAAAFHPKGGWYWAVVLLQLPTASKFLAGDLNLKLASVPDYYDYSY